MDMYNLRKTSVVQKEIYQVKSIRDRIEQTISDEKIEFDNGSIKQSICYSISKTSDTDQTASAMSLLLKSLIIWTVPVKLQVMVSLIG